MNKFVEKAQSLIVRFNMLSSIPDVEMYATRREELNDALLDLRILFYEFGNTPLIREVDQVGIFPNIPRVRYLLRKLIETAEFRRQSDE